MSSHIIHNPGKGSPEIGSPKIPFPDNWFGCVVNVASRSVFGAVVFALKVGHAIHFLLRFILNGSGPKLVGGVLRSVAWVPLCDALH